MYQLKLDGEVLEELGFKIQQLRKGNKYSQQQLADMIGVNRRLIGEIEAGKGTSLLIFVKLVKVFNKTGKLLELLESNFVSPKELFEKQNK